MNDSEVKEFFREKRPWSRYKDLILDYYLRPYLAKVLSIGKPVLVVDCFAGPGKFDDGSDGSPLIILRHLQRLNTNGANVRAVFFEPIDVLFDRLQHCVGQYGALAEPIQGEFQDSIDYLEMLSQKHTVFFYVDPIQPSDLKFHDLERTYQALASGQSIETLVNFISTGFVRWALQYLKNPDSDPEAKARLSEIAGGTYWIDMLSRSNFSHSEQIENVAEGYASALSQWFKWTLFYAIREKYEHEQPKYHLVFGSRHPDAIELMNRAMVKARREFLGAQFVANQLFDNRPAEEVVDIQRAKEALIATLRLKGRQSWKDLRILTTIRSPCMFTDTDFNRAIKAAINDGSVKSQASGKKIDENAVIWL